MHASMPFCHHCFSPYSASACASTAAAAGAHSPTAPACCAAMAADAHPARSAASTSGFSAFKLHTRRNPALNASPAPFVSTTRATVHAGALQRRPDESPASTPAAPRLITAKRTGVSEVDRSSPTSASSASSAVSLPVISHASTSLGMNRSTAPGPRIAPRIAGERHSPFGSKFGSIETFTPRFFSAARSDANPPCTPGVA
mmetsp:Transcript_10042/g.42228  ORF Transcript_10042/g.42228 Transcript_10042/m.42228 type:complete len:201 (-) Transcript_10042:555-1157(-)